MITITTAQWIIIKIELHCYTVIGIYCEQNLEMIRTFWFVRLGKREVWKNVIVW